MTNRQQNKIFQFVVQILTQNYLCLTGRFVKLTVRFSCMLAKTNEANICKSATTHVGT
jgi:hypothetical protein